MSADIFAKAPFEKTSGGRQIHRLFIVPAPHIFSSFFLYFQGIPFL
jgi:hypothetical protein